MSDLKEITCLLPERLKRIVETEVMVPGKNGFCKLSEIRIRINRPAILMYNNNKEKVIENIKITSDDIAYIIQMVTRYSMYAYQDSIRQGYVTVKGGHRIGGRAGDNPGRTYMRTEIYIIYKYTCCT